MKYKNNTTTKVKLNSFFILLGGFALLICLFTLMFCFVHSHRSQRFLQQTVTLNNCQENLDSCIYSLRLYVENEVENEYDAAQQSLNTAQEYLSVLYSSEQTTEILREIRDLRSMIDSLISQLPLLHDAMEQYHENQDVSFSIVQESNEEIQAICSSISIQEQLINDLLLARAQDSSEYLQTRMRKFIFLFFLVFVSMYLILFTEIQKLSRSITAPISLLIQKAEEIRSGVISDELLELLPGANKEISVLTTVFNDMTICLKKQMETMEENARIRQELEESRFKELQMQINPHFMFNTLNMISETAYFENADQTVLLLEKAAKMFRFSLDFSGKTITLYQELDELGNYVFLQEQRFGDRIRFRFELDERFHDIRIPSLILQPLVENAITHGIGMYTKDAFISIRTHYQPDEQAGYLIVEDNGVGMSSELLEQVQASMQDVQNQTVKIGLGNVYKRLKIFFGDRMDLKIASKEKEGTRVTIRLPYNTNEEKLSINHSR